MPAGRRPQGRNGPQVSRGEVQHGPHHPHQQEHQLILREQRKTTEQVKTGETLDLRHPLLIRPQHHQLLPQLQVLLPGLHPAQVVVINPQDPPKRPHPKRQPRLRHANLLKIIKVQPDYFCQLLQDVRGGGVLADHDRVASGEGVPLAADHEGYEQYRLWHQRTLYGCFYLYEQARTVRAAGQRHHQEESKRQDCRPLTDCHTISISHRKAQGSAGEDTQ